MTVKHATSLATGPTISALLGAQRNANAHVSRHKAPISPRQPMSFVDGGRILNVVCPSFRAWMLGVVFRVGWPGVALGVVD
jgi:hypothetical protein